MKSSEFYMQERYLYYDCWLTRRVTRKRRIFAWLQLLLHYYYFIIILIILITFTRILRGYLIIMNTLTHFS